MQPEMKAITLDLKAVDGSDPNGEFEAILSTPSLDRDGETVAAGAFNPLPASIPVHYAHDFVTGQPPIGSAEPYYDGDVLKVKGRFAPTERAQEFRELVAGGFIKSMSAGFLTTKRRGKSILQGDLFEGSLTAVPVNPTAMVLASKALKAGARNNATDTTRLQQIHDLSVENGAACSGMKSLKAVAGSLEQRSQELYEVLAADYPDADWVETIATFDDRVIYEVHGGSSDDTQFERPYTFDGNDITLGDAQVVEATEDLTVTPKSLTDHTEPPAAAAAETAAAAEDEEVELQRQRVRVWQHQPA